MSFDELKKSGPGFFQKFSKRALLRVVGELKNFVESLHGEVTTLKEEIQKLKNEII